jgi:hypothetical protein
MIDSLTTAREDLAFLRAIAEDRGPLPTIFGAHLLAVGLPYGLNLVYIWAARAGYVAWPDALGNLVWIPGTVVYLPLVLWLVFRGPKLVLGPTARVFGAAWCAVGVMTLVLVLVIIVATVRTGLTYHDVWPPISFALYGGSWTVIGLIRRRAIDVLIAVGCFATAVASAAFIGRPELWLALGVGLILFVAAPGASILRQGRPVL